MNVLMVTGDKSVLTEGSPTHALLMEQASVSNRLVVIVLNGHMSFKAPHKVSDSLWIFPTNSWMPFMRIANALYIVRHEIFFQNKLQADLIVGNDPTTAGFTAYLIALMYKRPLHIFVGYNPLSRLYIGRSFLNVFRAIFAWFIMRYALTVSVSDEGTKKSIQRFNPAMSEGVMVIPRYIDIDAIEAMQIKPEDDLHMKYTKFRAIILLVAPLVKGQNIEVAIEALEDISAYYTNIGLIIVGDGPGKRSLMRFAKKHDVADQVIIEPMRSDLMPYYKSAYMLMVTSPREAYGTVLEDAAAAGCAIISTPIDIAPLIIEDGKSGYLCDPTDHRQFSASAGALIRNAPQRQSVKQNILVSIKSRMSKDPQERAQLFKNSWEAALKATRV